MAIDESEILLSAALAGALPYALMALVEWGRRLPRHGHDFMHRLGARQRSPS